MQWTDEATVLSARKHGENSVVVRVLSHHHGVYAGVVKGAHSKTNRGLYQSGNILTITWNARLAEHIGTLKGEMVEPTAALVMQDAVKLAALTSACALIEISMPERHPYPALYKHLRIFLHHLLHAEDWQENYVKLELALLAESGFGLDLSECAANGQKDDLFYVSPKSGRAVSREAGEPYKDKLLPLPEFLLPKALPPKGGGNTMEETLAGLRLSGYFLEHWLAEPHGKKLPAARGRLIQTLKASHDKRLEYQDQ